MLRLRSWASSTIRVSYSSRDAVLLDLGQQHAVGHQLDGRLRAHPVVEADLVAHQAPQLGLQLLGHAAGQGAGGDAPGLGVADAPGHPAPQVQAQLGELGGLAGAGLAAQDHHLMGGDQGRDLLAALAHRQFRRVMDRAGIEARRRSRMPWDSRTAAQSLMSP